ncbi:MAG TPA: DNA-binding protein [Vicinamibacteria bacterium]|nr:DNA-binding protein [Vicinamibacteria bacterium]
MSNLAWGAGALFAAGLLPLLAASQSMAHHGGGHCGCPHCAGLAAPGTAPAGQYDPDTVTTLRGTVTNVAVISRRGGRAGGVHVVFQSGEATHEAVLGPSWFLEREGVSIAKGDSVEVTGSLVDSDGTDVLIAAQLKKGEKTVRLRDEQGFPAWAGGQRR